MILAPALAFLAASPVVPPVGDPETEADAQIVVIGRLRSLEASVGQDKEGRWHCSLSRSTGQPKLDDKFCRAVTKCVQKGATQTAEVRACIEDKRARLVREVERSIKKDTK